MLSREEIIAAFPDKENGIGANQATALPMPERFWAKTERVGECVMWTARRNPKGYGQFGYRGRQEQAHRVAWMITNGPIPNGMIVCHKCDTPPCVNPEHLFVGTHRDNALDAVRKGRKLTGKRERHGRAKLKEADIVVIRSTTRQTKALAERFGVHRTTIQAIRRGKLWRERKNKLPNEDWVSAEVTQAHC